MGVVYHADDLTLRQHVALKYIPLLADAGARERFYSEARIGRQLAHPNVCRVYDIVETGDQQFIAMEYVDGENLDTLLRRIGRLPADKVLHLARDLCSGLAAAHERGFIHRDLKPANIMIDGRGVARITDFGLAALAGEVKGELAGTPAYMAPEQLAGGTATARSDLYSLGLVLFEMFTGRPVFETAPLAAIREQHAQPKPRVSLIVRDIDPEIERLIERCIHEDPTVRPASAREVLTALPGGDPLAAAVAAGETPSPEMVAAANTVGDLKPARAWTLLGTLVALLVLAMFIGARALLTWFAPEVRSRDAQIERAHAVKRALGYDDGARDWNGAYVKNNDLLTGAVAASGVAVIPVVADWTREFHYRDGPQKLIALNASGRVTRDDPPFQRPGMTSVMLDGKGKLREFRRVPASAAEPVRIFDWASAFREAGLDPARFHPAASMMVPPAGADRRFAWDGVADGVSLHVEAASERGWPVWFVVTPPWKVKSAIAVRDSPGVAIVYLVAFAAGLILGRRNVLRGRADLRGARKLAIAAGIVQFAMLLCRADHTTVFVEEWRMLMTFAGAALFFALVIWICHITIEPYVRRRWPHMLVSTKRLMSGRVRDPLVGADILRGLIAGVAGIVAWYAAEILLRRQGLYVPRDPAVYLFATNPLGMPALVFTCLTRALLGTLPALVIIVLARLLLKRDVLAFVILWIVLFLAADDLGGSFPVDCLLRAILFAPIIYAARRWGVLTLMTAWTVMFLLVYTPFTPDMSLWYGRFSALVMLAVVAVGVYGFHTALAGKPLFGNILVEDEVAV